MAVEQPADAKLFCVVAASDDYLAAPSAHAPRAMMNGGRLLMASAAIRAGSAGPSKIEKLIAPAISKVPPLFGS